MIASPSGMPFEPRDSGSLSTATEWLAQLATGSVAATLSILAIATVGLLMLAGRLPLREGARVVIGCFVLLGAQAIAAALMGLSAQTGPVPPPPIVESSDPRAGLPPSNYDPYAGASLRSD